MLQFNPAVSLIRVFSMMLIVVTHYMFLKEPFSLSILPLHAKGLVEEMVLFSIMTIVTAIILKKIYDFILVYVDKTK